MRVRGVSWWAGSQQHCMVRVGAPGTACFQYPSAAVEVWVGSLRPVAWCWQGEGRVVYIRNLSSNMSSSELKKRFEVFGEIVECQVLSRTNRWVARFLCMGVCTVPIPARSVGTWHRAESHEHGSGA